MIEAVVFNEANLLASLKTFMAGFEGIFASVEHRRSLQVAGATLDIASNDLSYVQQAERALATRDMPGESHCRIAVINANDALCPAPFWPLDGFMERRIEASLSGTPYRLHYFDDLNFWQIYDADRSIGIQWMAKPDGFPLWDTGSPLRNFVQWHLSGDDRSLLHSGTLALNGNGVLLAGEGGAGKSSTVLAGIFGGLQSVGDDYVMVDLASLTARPVFDTLKQDEKGLRRLGQWNHAAIPKDANWQNKHQFYLPDVAAETLASSIDLKAILLPNLTHGANTTVTPADAKTAFLALAPSGVSQIHCDRARLFSVAGQAARQLPAFQLNLGTDPDEIVGALRMFLEVGPWS